MMTAAIIFTQFHSSKMSFWKGHHPMFMNMAIMELLETQILATLGQMHLMVMIMRLLIGLTWVCSKEDFISQ